MRGANLRTKTCQRVVPDVHLVNTGLNQAYIYEGTRPHGALSQVRSPVSGSTVSAILRALTARPPPSRLCFSSRTRCVPNSLPTTPMTPISVVGSKQ